MAILVNVYFLLDMIFNVYVFGINYIFKKKKILFLEFIL